MFERCLDDVWTMFGRCLDDVSTIFGRCLDDVWAMFGQCLDPRRKNIKNWALLEPNELIICMRVFVDMAKKILMVPGL